MRLAPQPRSLTLAVATFACLAIAACDGDSGTTADTTTADTAADTTADTAADTTPPADTTPADTAETCANPCLDEFGKNDKGLCPAPAANWNCISGCCVEIFKCLIDADCTTQGFVEEHCLDDRFDCRCDTDTRRCFEWTCADNDDCGSDELCAGGICKAEPTAQLKVRILSRPTTLVTGATVQLLADAYSTDDEDISLSADIGWASDAEGVVSVDASGTVTGGATTGQATITATLTGTGETATIVIRNVAPVSTDTLTVVVVDELTHERLEGHYALTDPDDNGTIVYSGLIPASGVIISDMDLGTGIDLHIFPKDNDWLSFLGLTGKQVIYAPSTRRLHARVELSDAVTIDTEATELVNVGIVRGTPDLSDYTRLGQFEISVASFGLSAALFDFSLPVLLGNDVKRFLHPDHKIPLVDASEPLTVPGGITFGLDGPAIDTVILTAPEGRHRLWTLGGRLDVNDVANYAQDIVNSISGGDLDFTKLIGAVFPTFESFWSGYDSGVTVTTIEDASVVVDIAPKLRQPLSLGSIIDVPKLPAFSTAGYADALFLLGGALTPDGTLIPLGLSGGADTADKESNPPDGYADGDDTTPEKDPFKLPLAAMHSGLQGPHSRYLLAIVAVAITGSNDPRPDGGSAILIRGDIGAGPPAKPDMGEFLGFPLDSTWDGAARTVHVGTQSGADLQRVLFKGKRGDHWTVWTRGVTDFKLPLPSDVEETLEDRATEGRELILINSLDLGEGVTEAAILAPGGPALDTLLGFVDRVSFLDVRDPINLGSGE